MNGGSIYLLVTFTTPVVVGCCPLWTVKNGWSIRFSRLDSSTFPIKNVQYLLNYTYLKYHSACIQINLKGLWNFFFIATFLLKNEQRQRQLFLCFFFHAVNKLLWKDFKKEGSILQRIVTRRMDITKVCRCRSLVRARLKFATSINLISMSSDAHPLRGTRWHDALSQIYIWLLPLS